MARGDLDSLSRRADRTSERADGRAIIQADGLRVVGISTSGWHLGSDRVGDPGERALGMPSLLHEGKRVSGRGGRMSWLA